MGAEGVELIELDWEGRDNGGRANLRKEMI